MVKVESHGILVNSKSQSVQNKNFIMVLLGQIVSAFGSSILRFAIPLYLLEISGSPALFGTVMALSALPTVILSPIGGVLADRVNKKKIMVVLDFTMAALVLLYMLTIGVFAIVPATIAIMMALFGVTTMMDPAVEGSIPLIVPADQLVKANSLISLVGSLSNLLGPALGGILFAGFGLYSILIVCVVAKFLAAIMEIFIRIPNVKQEAADNVFAMVFGDMAKGLRFIFKECPQIAKIMITIFLVQITLAPLATIGIPVLISHNLGMDGSAVGIAQGAMGVGGILGGILTGILGKKLRIQKAHWLLFAGSIVFATIGIAFMVNAHYSVIYITILSLTLIAMCLITLITIQIFTFIQTETPPEMLGKVSALSTMLIMVGITLGQFIFGMLFEQFESLPWVVVFIATGLSAMVALNSRRYFKGIIASAKA